VTQQWGERISATTLDCCENAYNFKVYWDGKWAVSLHRKQKTEVKTKNDSNKDWQEKGTTYVTAYWAKDRYSTSTSRPLFSSLRNSLTHLWRTKHWITCPFPNWIPQKSENELNWLDSPDVIGPKRYLQLSEHLSRLLNSPPKFLWRNRKRCPFLSKYVLNLSGPLQKPVTVWNNLHTSLNATLLDFQKFWCYKSPKYDDPLVRQPLPKISRQVHIFMCETYL